MADPFDIPLADDVGAFTPEELGLPAPAPHQQMGQPDQKKAKRREWLKLAALIPAALKGGPGALEGVLAGFQQADLLQQQRADQEAVRQRQAMQEQRLLQNDQFAQALRVREYEQRQEAERAKLVGEFTNALLSEDLTDPEAVSALTQLYEARGRVVGLRPGAFETTAMQVVKPARLIQNKVRARWEGMGVEEKRTAQQMQASMLVDGKTIPYAEWQVIVGGLVDPTTGAYPQAAAKPEIPNTPEEQFYQSFATERGKKAFGELSTADQTAARKAWMQADDKPEDPTLRAIRELTLAQKAQTPTGLPPAVARRVDTLVKGFDTQAIVKTVQKQAEAVAFVNGLNVNTTNPADDQALIYAFAKAMDPDSVVREGEYATVQKYAQSWAERFGFDMRRIFSNTQFLTPQARANMKTTIQARYRAGKNQYDNLRRSYASRINRITGQPDGEDYLTDYGGGFPEDAPAPAAPTPTAPTSGGGAAVPNPFRRR